MEIISGIYCIENLISGNKYVGKSNNIYKRWADEVRALNKQEFHNIHVQRSWNKYSEDAFRFYILDICDISELSQKEQYWINKLDTYHNGYNQTLGGEGSIGAVCSEEKRQKIRDAHIGEKNFNVRPVYCVELNQTFWGAKEAEILYRDLYKVKANGICMCCKGKQSYHGKLPDGTRLHWCYDDEKEDFTIPAINREQAVYCNELDEIFYNISMAVKDSRVIGAYNANITACCNNHPQHQTCGKLSDGTKLTWRYATENELLTINCA